MGHQPVRKELSELDQPVDVLLAEILVDPEGHRDVLKAIILCAQNSLYAERQFDRLAKAVKKGLDALSQQTERFLDDIE
jgi:hypothetical protein